ncbi:hypothetical protein PAV_10c00780 [Paenibacillus alvei DSM 29]|nr:hypothetical protein PAV_10c00780 [Paenibacillus alvei DSM 29]
MNIMMPTKYSNPLMWIVRRWCPIERIAQNVREDGKEPATVPVKNQQETRKITTTRTMQGRQGQLSLKALAAANAAIVIVSSCS